MLYVYYKDTKYLHLKRHFNFLANSQFVSKNSPNFELSFYRHYEKTDYDMTYQLP